MYCKNCKQEISDSAGLCPYCGADQTAYPDETMVQNPMYQYQQAAQPVYQGQAQQYPAHQIQVAPAQAADGKDFSSIILLAFVVFFFVTSLIGILISEFMHPWDYGETGWILFYQVIHLLRNLSFILIPLAIKKMPLKIAAFALIIPPVLYLLFYNVKNIIELL